MKKRCIMIFPEFENVKAVDEIREKFDPLANHVRPHVTLVFPFRSDLTKEALKSHLERNLKDSEPFELVLRGIKGQSSGNYIFLDVKKGKQELKRLQRRLYTGPLTEFYPSWLKRYDPHMTVGRVEDTDRYHHALQMLKQFDEKFVTIVRKISVEIIDENEDSEIEFEIELSTRDGS